MNVDPTRTRGRQPGARPGVAWLVLAVASAISSGCFLSSQTASDLTTIRVEGSDTMVNLAQAWAERYHAVNPQVSVQVLGGGSGVGIASLTDGNCDLANSSRDISPEESALIRQKRQADPVEHIVGYDALAVFVHPSNPIESISLDELARIYGEVDPATRWTQLGIDHSVRGSEKVVVVGRQNSSGTYTFFREVVLGKKRDFKLGIIDRSGSKDVVSLVGTTPLAIGYSGMGYATDEVKVLPVSRKAGDAGMAPTLENVRLGAYPLTRALQVYSVGQSRSIVEEYMAWMMSREGQEIVVELGYVPVEP